MAGAEPFFDTNVLLYLLSDDAEKADRAESLLAEGGIVSVQVLNEFASVATRKAGLEIAEIREILAAVRGFCSVRVLDLETHDLGLDIAGQHGYSIYDSLVIAAAKLAGCAELYSEDMQSGQTVVGVRIGNPFRNQ